MSKIICDVCGTSYAETATQCPICGCIRPSDVTVVSGDTSAPETAENATYTYVKGGRFSKSNVRRRSHSERGSTPSQPEVEETAEPMKAKGDRDTGLVVAVCVLLLAIVSAVIYIAIHFFSQAPAAPTPENTWQNDTTPSTTIAATTTSNEIVCTDILVSKTSVEFTEIGASCTLVVTKNPADTTDVVLFASSNEAVARVTNDGTIEAVGNGDAVISITCGNAKAECNVSCRIASLETMPNTQETTPAEDETPEETGVYKISHTDVTLTLNGEAHLKSFKLTLKDSNDNAKDVKWIVGDPSVCKVSGNTVTATKTGYTKVKTTVDGVTYECIVRVR